jgi:ribonucleoside-diphosphate reductase alpha chain
MLKCKSGEWWVKHPYRARANNSAVLPRNEVTQEEFNYIFDICQKSGSGEPGFSWTSNVDWGFNPCHEISLNHNQFCNLSTVNQTGIVDKRDFLSRVYSAALIGTLQAAYTDFPYLRPEWKETTEADALIGVSFTGIADSGGIVSDDWLQEAAKLVLEVNEKYAKKIGINLAARTTTLKPEGTSSCVLGSASGVHARHSTHYLRRFRITKGDSLDNYLRHVIPELVEDDIFSATGSVVTIPQESPEQAIVRENETAMSLLERVYRYNKLWVANGHRSGDNKNNVSATISVKDDEWQAVRDSMWTNREVYSGISLLPYDGGRYQQAPFEECSKEKYEEYSKLVKEIDLKAIVEVEDGTRRTETISCSGGVCEITSL